MNYVTIDKCRVCDNKHLKTVLKFGDHPPSNALQDSLDVKEEKFPLTLVFCEECGLVQILETVSKELLFSKYFWVTSTSSTACEFAFTFFDYTKKVKKLSKDDLVIEIASNDGTFLKPFVDEGYNVLGVDPAGNITEIANKNGIKTITAFWNAEEAKKITNEYGKSKLIFARNVVPHVSELHSVIEGIKYSLSDDGVGAIEFHYVGNIYQGLQYDSVYHEHLCYFSIKSIEHLLNLYGLNLFHIDLSPISGGAYIVYFSINKREITEQCNTLKQKEENIGVNSLDKWQEFASRCKKHREISHEMIKSFAGKTVVGFGASARSSTYLNFCGFNSSHIDVIIDNNPLKKHKYSPGSLIKIVPQDEGFGMNPELIFLLAWNFKDEILKLCKDKGYKGKYLIPYPDMPYMI